METQSAEDESAEKVAKALGEPFSVEFPETVRKMRTNLLLASSIAVLVTIFGVEVNPSNLQIAGISFNRLTGGVIYMCLFMLTLYLLTHFLWASVDQWVQWRVRITGTRTTFVTTAILGSEHADYGPDPRQTSLYRWWISQAKQLNHLSENVDEIKKTTEQVLVLLREKSDSTAVAGREMRSVQDLQRAIDKLSSGLENTRKLILSQRIPASLERFDRWFELMLRSQNLYWLLFEFGLPLVFGSFATYQLWTKI
ncbi:MAG TPA: hypothetical protein PLW86_09410 [Rhodocyclaceae bacterium]|nr:hypothetical protein [Rhodocyclaceae bacterium]